MKHNFIKGKEKKLVCIIECASGEEVKANDEIEERIVNHIMGIKTMR